MDIAWITCGHCGAPKWTLWIVRDGQTFCSWECSRGTFPRTA